MSEATYAAMREFIRVAVELEVKKAMPVIPEIRSVEPVVGPPGKDGVAGKDGIDGKDGVPGKDGANGIATREELKAAAQEVFADFQVRTFADVWQGTYKNGELYNRGLLTTWGGSLWLSMAETRARPGETPDWKLVVKK